MILRRLRPVLVTAFFLSMMALLAKDHVLPRFREGTEATVDAGVLADMWVDQDEFLTARFGGKPIGGLRVSAERIAGDVPAYLYLAKLEVRTAFVAGSVGVVARANRRLELEQFRASIHAGSPEPDAPPMMEIAGLVHQGELLLRARDAGGATRFSKQPLQRPIVLADAMQTLFMQAMREPGKLYTLDIVEPVFNAQMGQAQVTYERREETQTAAAIDGVPAGGRINADVFRVVLNGLESRYWISETGRVVRRIIYLGSDPTGTAPAGSRIQLLLEAADAAQLAKDYPGLRVLPAMPEYKPGDFAGESTGDPLKGLGIMSLLGRGSALQRALPASGDPAPKEKP
jgi:hypothetical protein